MDLLLTSKKAAWTAGGQPSKLKVPLSHVLQLSLECRRTAERERGFECGSREEEGEKHLVLHFSERNQSH